MVALNLYNWYYITYFVIDPNAIKETKLSVKKVKKLEEMYKKSQKRRAAYEAAMAKEALTNKEMAAALDEIQTQKQADQKEGLLEGGEFNEGGSAEEIGPGDSLSQRGSESEDDDHQYYIDFSSSDEECEGGVVEAELAAFGKGQKKNEPAAGR